MEDEQLDLPIERKAPLDISALVGPQPIPSLEEIEEEETPAEEMMLSPEEMDDMPDCENFPFKSTQIRSLSSVWEPQV